MKGNDFVRKAQRTIRKTSPSKNFFNVFLQGSYLSSSSYSLPSFYPPARSYQRLETISSSIFPHFLCQCFLDSSFLSLFPLFLSLVNCPWRLFFRNLFHNLLPINRFPVAVFFLGHFFSIREWFKRLRERKRNKWWKNTCRENKREKNAPGNVKTWNRMPVIAVKRRKRVKG